MWKTPLTPTEFRFSSARTFQVWRYVVSHKQLLLRSNKEQGRHTTRVEVYFKNVRSMDVPTTMVGLTVEPLGDGSFKLSGVDWVGSVEAGGAWAVEDDGEYGDASTFMPDEGPTGVPA